MKKETRYLFIWQYAVHMATVRANETPEESATRLQINAVHMASVRVNETPEESATRRQINAVQTATARENETQEQVTTRRQNNFVQTAAARVSVIKYGGRFGQYGFKGNAVLFELDIFQVSEKLPDMLPRSSENAAIVIVTETLDNLNHSRNHTISRDRVYATLRWLVKYNRLYKDVAMNHFDQLESEDIIRVIPAKSNEVINPEMEQYDNDEETRKSTKYKRVSDNSRIVHAS
ncbi:ATP-dependent DNA helicase [Nephila pilipes]|uniref:ATP-dependent DNA helicase n=1 Tax=Nephila pilipes TaxID=299642 RepID=A0A8X6PA18_NEPPI|nr:ATP-dependent DNA helicase [Nephila pilipes]